MTDIALQFSDLAGGDLVLAGLDLARDDGLETAVLVSLFTDRRADPEQIRAGEDASDLRGWWGDYNPTVDGDQTGSHLWLLRREKQTAETLKRGRQYSERALAWMVEDRVAGRVQVTTEYVHSGTMGIDVAISRQGGDVVRYRFEYEWAAQTAKRVS